MWRCSLAWLIIAGVVAYDNSLTIQNSTVMADVEINPMGRWILSRPDGVPLLVGLKTLGVSVAFLAVFVLWQWPCCRRYLIASSVGVAVFQMGLLAFLSIDFVGMRIAAIARECEAANARALAATTAPAPVVDRKYLPWTPATVTAGMAGTGDFFRVSIGHQISVGERRSPRE